MPSTAALDLVVQLRDNASKGLDEIAEKGGFLGDALKKGALIAGGAILGLGGVLVGAAKAASDEQVGMDRLGTTLKDNIPHWKGSEDAVEGYVAKMEGMAFADDAIRDSLNQLIPRTHDLAQAQNLQAIAMDLARQKGIDLETATTVIGKVYSGNVGILQRYGIAVDKGATSTEALAAIQEMAKGQAQAYADSAAGSAERLDTAFHDAFETIGHSVLNAVSGPLKQFADWLSSPAVQAGIQQVADFIGGALTTAFNIAGQVVSAVWPIIQPFFDAVVGFIKELQGGADLGTAVGNLFSNLGAAIANAWSIVGPALGQLLGNILQWIGDNGPAILATLGQWALAFGNWVITQAVPWLFQQLGALIVALWNWITANGPTILQTLGQWAVAFGDWVWNKAIPWMLEKLAYLATKLWIWIQENGPTILAKLGEWATAFGDWVWNKAIPWLFQQLGDLITKTFAWIQANGPTILEKLGEWAKAFGSWVWDKAIPWLLQKLGDLLGQVTSWLFNHAPDILATLGQWAQAFATFVVNLAGNLPIWLAKVIEQVWTWITESARDIAKHLVNEWIPAALNWIAGPGGVTEKIGAKLGEIAQKIWTWITNTATDAKNKVLAVGQSIVDGIKSGISNAWTGFTSWILGLLSGMVDAIKKFFISGSPSILMANEVGEPIAQGIQLGWSNGWPAVQSTINTDLTNFSNTLGQTIDGSAAKLAVVTATIPGQLATYVAALAQTQVTFSNSLAAVTAGLEGALEFGWDSTWGLAQERSAQILALYNDVVNKVSTGIDLMGAQLGNAQGQGTGGQGGGAPRGYASGGVFDAGELIMVGERGPELIWTGRRSGEVISHGTLERAPASGGGGSVNISGDIIINAAPGMNGGQLASEFIEALSHEIGVSEAIRIGKGRR